MASRFRSTCTSTSTSRSSKLVCYRYERCSLGAGRDLVKREIFGWTSGLFLPPQKESAIALGSAQLRRNAQLLKHRVDPRWLAFELCPHSDWRFVQHQVAFVHHPFCA